jgi:SAM-dependent methyltransferase
VSERPPILAPGTLLQLLYLRERLALLQPGRFFEVGVGQGNIARLLLEEGWTGAGCDLNEPTVQHARAALDRHVREGRFAVDVADWLSEDLAEDVDLVISSMVIEHLHDSQERAYLDRCREALASGGRIMLFVPASPAHWGIEDDIAGHIRRYTRLSLATHLADAGWRVEHLAGLTFPLSNLVLPLSNLLVGRAEGKMATQSLDERTRASGNRSVKLKTEYPPALRMLLNERSMLPLHWLQKRHSDSADCLVLYAEAVPV